METTEPYEKEQAKQENKQLEPETHPDTVKVEESPDNTKTVTTINIDQSNEAESGDKQVNKVELLIKRIEGDLNFYGDGTEGKEIKKIVFRELQTNQNNIQVSEEDLVFIAATARQAAGRFQESRIAVINNDLPGQGLVVPAVELLIKNLQPTSTILCCQAADDESFESIFNQFIIESRRIKRKKSNDQLILVIFRNRTESSSAVDFLQPVLFGGGIANSYTSALIDERLYLVSIENDRGLYKIPPGCFHHSAILNFSELHQLLFDKITDKDELSQTIKLVETAIAEYSWLANLTPKEKSNQLKRLIDEERLEETLKNLINNIEKEEGEKIRSLLSDNLYRVLLFAGCFFEGIRIDEFYEVVRCLLEPGSHSDGERKKQDDEGLIPKWERGADECFVDCGISLGGQGEYIQSYFFESEIRKSCCKTIFIERYPLWLIKNSGNLEQKYLFSNERVSEGLLRSVIEVLFLTAKNDRCRHITDVCVEMAEELERDSDPDLYLNEIFRRLFAILQMWGKQQGFSQYIGGFYDRMSRTPVKRSYMGIILAHLCRPMQEQNLGYLKMLLDASGDEESLICFNIPKIIAGNFSEKIGLLINEIESWTKERDDDSSPRSYAFAKTSLLFLFYEKRFSWGNSKGIDHFLLKNTTERSSDGFQDLCAFIFSRNALAIFSRVWGKRRGAIGNSKSGEEKAIQDIFYRVIAYVLIQWKWLFKQFTGNEESSLRDEEALIGIAVGEIGKHYSLKGLVLALRKSAQDYSNQIVEINEGERNQRARKEEYKVKRSYARSLAEQIDKLKNQPEKY